MIAGSVGASLLLTGCGNKFNPASGAPPTPRVVNVGNPDLVTVAHPEWFPVVKAGQINEPGKMDVTGAVFPDVNREVPVISLASGRVVDIRATLDQNVAKGQLLLRVQSPDITNAFDAYLKAKNDEQLAGDELVRARDLYGHGAISLSDLQQAQNAQADAQADLNAANQQLNTLGVNRKHPSDIVNVYAPISGVIISQNVTAASATGVTYSGTPNAFTIADLSRVWVICDVYQNELPHVHLDQLAEIKVNGYPNLVLTGHVSDIGPVLDPTLRTAKVRIVVANPGRSLRLGMFVTATLIGRKSEVHATVPADAILHLHDEDWVFVPAGGHNFRRVEVQAGGMLPGNQEEIVSGIQPGEPVVRSVLQLESQLEAQ
ncbi:efflux RND transporter periplasmic adaptor subunit [Acidobacterium capsulatum]|uniref:Efflux transporter, RND family, MFP subunit n=2 Tax=Acidobacterium TaxID=33973 RepID=C1F6Q5_ACIC5|nr:efflux RND transporter periplasmic adaptor subunit [Acidobacterium capsulatum]ACO34354.1 efflux transporter, RND family, MFP subunit [Acidobacterium capsulatum ATCC 51196]